MELFVALATEITPIVCVVFSLTYQPIKKRINVGGCLAMFESINKEREQSEEKIRLSATKFETKNYCKIELEAKDKRDLKAINNGG